MKRFGYYAPHHNEIVFGMAVADHSECGIQNAAMHHPSIIYWFEEKEDN